MMEKKDLPNAMGRGSGMAKLSPSGVRFMMERLQQHLKEGDRNKHCYSLIGYALQKNNFYALDAKDSLFKEINDEKELKEAEEAIQKHFHSVKKSGK